MAVPGTVNNSGTLLVFMLSALLLSGCLNNNATFTPAPADAVKGSVIYVYRPASSANFMMSPRVVVDDNARFQVASGKYRYMYLQPGEHSIGLYPSDQYETASPVGLHVEADKSYFLRVGTSLEFNPDGMNDRSFWIESVDEQLALDEITTTEYAGGKRIVIKKSYEAEQQEGFSVDRTGDPFAGKNATQ